VKKVSVREVQHNLRKVLQYLEHGDEIIIMRRNTAIAKIVPFNYQASPTSFPDFAERRKKLFPHPEGKSLGDIILEDRL
jgi:antitoxin (DNA-binding transcriptional repressor) of toxin-antitoxin stability system